MTSPGGEPTTEAYQGPPPTRRPEPWQQVPWAPPPAWGPPPWGAPPGGPPVPWGPPPPWGWAPPPPPPVRWAPPKGTPPHDEPRSFLTVMRMRDWAWWRPLLGLFLVAVVYGVLLLATGFLGILGLLASGTDPGALPDLLVEDMTDPWVLLFLNVSLIVAIPCVWLAWAAAHGTRPGWSSSVLGRLRRRLLAPYALLALGTVGVGIALAVLLQLTVGGEEITGPVPDFGWLLVVVLLTTPLQSAAEEYLFRGYLSQAVAGWIRAPGGGAVVAAVLSALLFAAAHGAQDPLTFLDRFAFGLTASAVVWLTGGLEAAIAVHAVNNVVVFVLAGGLGGGVATEEVPAGTGVAFGLVSLLSMAAFVAVVARTRGRLRPETRTAAVDLRLPAPPVPVPAR
ncbi:UNVERIFIED_ORG: CPBP family intramembrane metalloprotease [Bacillus sp. AZ43]